MAQITIYLPDKVEARARRAAKAGRKSVSKWIADEVTRTLDDTWPQSVVDAAGIAPDFPDIEELRKGYGKDIPRIKL
jgi:hypothetical protein